jgi:hypothetical protein
MNKCRRKLSEKITYKTWMETEKLLYSQIKSQLVIDIRSSLEHELKSIQFNLLDSIHENLKIKKRKNINV